MGGILMEDLLASRVDLSDQGQEHMPSIHPGEHLRDWLDESGVSAYALAKDMGVPPNRLTAILAGERAVTADTAIRLGKAIGTSAEMWMGLQASYDLEVARLRQPSVDPGGRPRLLFNKPRKKPGRHIVRGLPPAKRRTA
jgi:addiction module HigA family antidote